MRKRFLLPAFFSLCIVVFAGCSAEIRPADHVTWTGAQLHAVGHSSCKRGGVYRFEWATTQEALDAGQGTKGPLMSFGITNGACTANPANFPISANVNGLAPKTGYVYRLCGHDAGATTFACTESSSFRTNCPSGTGTSETLEDPWFRNGLKPISPLTRTLDPWQLQPPGATANSVWEMAQWWSHSDMSGPGAKNNGDYWGWRDKNKRVDIGCRNSVNKPYDLVLGVNTESEYDMTFKTFTPDADGKYSWPDHPKWVHLYAGRSPKITPSLDRLKHINFGMKAKLLGSRIRTPQNCAVCKNKAAYSYGHNVLHWVHQVVIRNVNSASAGKGQGITIMVNIYSSKDWFVGAHQSLDPVMGILMYRLDQQRFTKTSLNSGSEATFAGDFLPDVKNGLAYGCSTKVPGTTKNYVTSCNLADYKVVNVVQGWEANGLGTATVGIRDYRLDLVQ